MENKAGKYTYEYPRPALTADCVIFGFDGTALRVLLIERGIDPYKGYWALPGGFLKPDETIEECARRELLEETAVKDVFLEQFHCFSGVDRDPRGRVITVAFIALVRPSDHNIIGGDDAARAAWFNADELPPLAFDHREILKEARKYLKDTLILRPTAFHLLDEVFTIDELRKVYEVINGTTYDRRNFYRKLMKSDLVEEDLESEALSTSNDKAQNWNDDFLPISSESRKNIKLPKDQFTIPQSMVSIEESSSMDVHCSCSAARPERERKGRPPKFFRLASRFSSKFSDRKKSHDSDDDNSIKNLFNF